MIHPGPMERTATPDGCSRLWKSGEVVPRTTHIPLRRTRSSSGASRSGKLTERLSVAFGRVAHALKARIPEGYSARKTAFSDVTARSFPKHDFAGTWHIAIICSMELGSFIVEFFEHVPPSSLESWVAFFNSRGASVERHSDRVIRVGCTERKQLAFVGARLYSPAFSRFCQVTSTSGLAEARATAYSPTAR